jgi:hypothetical protein
MDTELQIKQDLFEKELNKLIEDFSQKKKDYYSKYVRLSWAVVIVNACVSFSLGISFIEKIAIQFKVIALIFSSVLLILNGAMNFLNYKNMYEQRTKTLVRLLSLRREYRILIGNEMRKENLQELYRKLEAIMQDDLSQWLDDIPKKIIN